MTLIILIFYLAGSDYCKGQDPTTFGALVSRRPPDRYEELRAYPDSIVYLFNPNFTPKADGELILPILYKIQLPTGLLHSYASGFDSFGFQYPEKQMIYIYLNRYSHNTQDTSYRVINDDETDQLLLDDLNAVNSRDKLDIDNNPFNPSRETWILKRGKATILLYNIRKEDAARFLHYTDSFRFL